MPLCRIHPVVFALILTSSTLQLPQTLARGSEPQQAAPPNIVMIISDDQAFTDYGFMGHPTIQTPNLDRLAGRSAVFRRGYVPSALCRPSLATLITGLYPHQHGITGNDPAPYPSVPADEYALQRERLIEKLDRFDTVPKLLASRTYLSHQSGKWWEGSFQRGGFTHGMTRGFPQQGGRHGDDGLKIGRPGMQPIFEFIDEAVSEQKPFFVWYAPFLPHEPHNPPERILTKYRHPNVPEELAKYFAMCEWFDETCGQLVDYLEQKKLADNTLIVYVTDNGWIQRTSESDFGPDWRWGFAPRSKQSPYEGGTRTPIMLCWPGRIEPADRPELVSSIDLVPTMLAAAEVAVPDSLPGVNLLPVLQGQPLQRDAIFGECFAHDIADIDDPQESLLHLWAISGRWKLLLTYDGRTLRNAAVHPRTVRAPQLFDLQQDPHETQNLAADHPDIIASLSNRIEEWWPSESRASRSAVR